jgi:hypothetical protein
MSQHHQMDFHPKFRDDETLIALLSANPTLTFTSSQDGKMLRGHDECNDYHVILPGNIFKEGSEYLAGEIVERLLQLQLSLFFDQVRRECQVPCLKCSWTWVIYDKSI